MIDFKKDPLLSLPEAAAIVPRVNGKGPNPSTVWRWMRHGVNGVRLESIRVGARIVTTEAALERFFQETAAAPTAPRPPRTVTTRRKRTPSQRAKDVAAAKARLVETGVLKEG